MSFMEECFSDGHQLVLLEASNKNAKCRICHGYICEASFYYCELCKYYCVHKTCYQFNHHFHPSHPLTLSWKRNQTFICNSCHKLHETNACYTCAQCDFYMDIQCARMPPITCDDFDHPNREHIQHFTHQHPMPLISTTKDGVEKIECCACRSMCSGEVYGCKYCEYFLHVTCAKSPREIQSHSFHKNHPLFLHIASRAFSSCKLCYKANLVFTFECRQCSFHFCLNCVTTMSHTINFKYHEHPLYFLEKINTKLGQCDGYESYCKNPILIDSEEFNSTNSSVFSCAECNFKVHLLCGLLPDTIKYEYHIHPLLFSDSVIENYFGEYSCDICESNRDPRLCVYFCEDCKFVAHVHCLASKIINILKGDLKDVKLKIVGENIWKFPQVICNNARVEEIENNGTSSLLTLKDLILRLTEGELRGLKECFYWDEHNKGEEEMSNKMITHLESEDEKIDEALGLSSLTETKFMSSIFNEFYSTFKNRKLKIKSSDLALKIVDFEGYFIPLHLVSILKPLLHIYGDISMDSLDSQEWKSICFFFICKVMKQMHTTLVIDITKDVLRDWYHCIKFVDYYVDFDLEFLKASLEEVMRDFFYLQVSKLLEVDIPTMMKEKMAELQKKMNEQMAEYRNKLETSKTFCETTSKMEFMKKGMDKMMKLKWKTAGQVGCDTSSSHYFF
ncbi:uncharacterized protein LOC133783810 [Humulus lupulus]|uniref:uncharacterized protein LOC133783810 n=1 Tax=Humulus lupulus TaxID=3486 RepID=UPI002B40C6C6|nr:uncharacterized protein LOC133783810 [Humulus lupulus]